MPTQDQPMSQYGPLIKKLTPEGYDTGEFMANPAFSGTVGSVDAKTGVATGIVEKPTLPNLPQATPTGTGTGAPTLDSLISASKVAVDKEDLRKQVESQFAPVKQSLQGRYERKIGEAKEASAQQTRSLEGELGTRRRFSTSAGAFINHINTENAKKVAELEVQMEDAITNLDFKMAEVLQQRIKDEKTSQQQEFENIFKIIEAAQKIEEDKAKKNEPIIKSKKEADILDLIDSGVTDQKTILDQLRTKYADASLTDIDNVMKSVETADTRNAEVTISDLLAGGAKLDVPSLLKSLTNKGQRANVKMVSGIVKSLRDAEKTMPGIVGEWLAAKENDPTMANWSLDDYANWKDPTKAQELKEQNLRIQKLQKEIDETGTEEDASNLYAYAQQYASTGMIPTGLPKGTFGLVATAAKEMPRSTGSIVNSLTGVTDSKTGQTEQADLTRLYNITNNVKKLKELDKNRTAGLLGGSLSGVFGGTPLGELQGKYMATRKSIVDDMSRMMSGAALTQDEVEFYQDYLPGRFSEPIGTGQNSDVVIENFEKLMNNRLSERLTQSGLSVYGYSKVKLADGKEYTVGDVIEVNGKQGRVLPDGSISIIE